MKTRTLASLLALHLSSYHVLSCWDLLILSWLIIPARLWAPPVSKCFPLFSLLSQVPGIETSSNSKSFSFSGFPAESPITLCFSRLHFIPLLPSFFPYFFCCIPFYISSIRPRFSKSFLQFSLQGFHSSIPLAAHLPLSSRNLLHFTPLGHISNLTDTFPRQKNKYLWAKSQFDMHQLGSTDFRGNAISEQPILMLSFALGDDCIALLLGFSLPH